MRVAIVGAGRMGSTFAFYLAQAGHAVTMVARGERLATLRKDGGIESVRGERVTLAVAETLDTAVPYDGVLVTVLAHQVPALLPTLAASAARSIVFLFNTVEALEPLREAVGRERAVFGFPSGFALLIGGKLRASFSAPGQEVTLSSAEWARTFREARLPSVVQPDMESFLRTHAAMVIPMMVSGGLAFQRNGGIRWDEARRFARVYKEGMAVVQRLGNEITPKSLGRIARLPVGALAGLLFLLNKLQVQRELGSMGPVEVRELIDGMQRLAPGAAPEMLAIRP